MPYLYNLKIVVLQLRTGKMNWIKSVNFTLLHSEWPKLHRVLAILSAVGFKHKEKLSYTGFHTQSQGHSQGSAALGFSS